MTLIITFIVCFEMYIEYDIWSKGKIREKPRGEPIRNLRVVLKCGSAQPSLFNVKREPYLNNILIFHHILLKIFLDPYGKGTFLPAKCVPSWEQRSLVPYTCYAMFYGERGFQNLIMLALRCAKQKLRIWQVLQSKFPPLSPQICDSAGGKVGPRLFCC